MGQEFTAGQRIHRFAGCDNHGDGRLFTVFKFDFNLLGRGVCGRRSTSGTLRPDTHISVALGHSLNLDQFFDQVFEGLVVHAELSAQGTDRYATVFLQVGFGVADDVEKGQRELSNI